MSCLPCRCGWYIVRLKLISICSLHRRHGEGEVRSAGCVGGRQTCKLDCRLEYAQPTHCDPPELGFPTHSTDCLWPPPVPRVCANKVHVALLKAQRVVPAGRQMGGWAETRAVRQAGVGRMTLSLLHGLRLRGG